MFSIIRLTEKNCQDCYKCIRNCLLKAITYSDGHAEIIQNECIDCGECVVACPRRGNFVENDLQEVRRQLRAGRRLVASIDPSFIAEFDVSCIEDLRDAMAHPDLHRDMIVRVGGYSEYWGNLTPALRKAVYERNVHRAEG